MDIKIEAPGHKSQELVRDHYTKKLSSKYSHYNFITSIDVSISSKDENMKKVSLQIKPEKGKMLYVRGQSERENVALNIAIRKMNVLIEKYKEKHYHTVHTVTKPNTDIT